MNANLTAHMQRLLLGPYLLDLATLSALWRWLPAWSRRWQTPAGPNAAILVGIYVVFLAGVYGTRRLAPAPPPGDTAAGWKLDRRLRFGLAALFGMALMTAVALQLGYFNVFMSAGPGDLGEGESAALFVFAPSAWLFLSMFYIFVLAFPVRPAPLSSPTASALAAWAALIAVNLMVAVAALQLRALLAADAPRWAAPLIPVGLLLLFLPPRLAYAAPRRDRSSLVSQLLLLAAVTWLLA